MWSCDQLSRDGQDAQPLAARVRCCSPHRQRRPDPTGPVAWNGWGAKWESCGSRVACIELERVCVEVLNPNDVCGCGSYTVLTHYTWECEQVTIAGQIENGQGTGDELIVSDELLWWWHWVRWRRWRGLPAMWLAIHCLDNKPSSEYPSSQSSAPQSHSPRWPTWAHPLVHVQRWQCQVQSCHIHTSCIQQWISLHSVSNNESHYIVYPTMNLIT